MTLRIMPELIAICLDQVEGKDQAGEHDGDRGAQLDQNVQGRAGISTYSNVFLCSSADRGER